MTSEPQPGPLPSWLTARLFAIVLLGIAAAGFVAGYFDWPWPPALDRLFDDFYANVVSEVLSIALTVLIIDALNDRRRLAEQREEQAANMALQADLAADTRGQITTFLKDQQAELDRRERQALINQLSSTVPGFAAEALRLLKHHNWAGDDPNQLVSEALTSGGDFERAELANIDLSGQGQAGARLVRANLHQAQLERVNLRDARLEWADLADAHLNSADLIRAQLLGADLRRASLERALMTWANLAEAKLAEADLSGADLNGA
ncbi:MAG: pentapeptide repeat-containing protein, partial [Chloroflexi bacterium]|nr:pentapeptide repeat-containing protein [Chloroflexota bacterium]